MHDSGAVAALGDATRLRPQRLRDVHAQLDRISKRWDDALERLRAFVEDDNAP